DPAKTIGARCQHASYLVGALIDVVSRHLRQVASLDLASAFVAIGKLVENGAMLRIEEYRCRAGVGQRLQQGGRITLLPDGPRERFSRVERHGRLRTAANGTAIRARLSTRRLASPRSAHDRIGVVRGHVRRFRPALLSSRANSVPAASRNSCSSSSEDHDQWRSALWCGRSPIGPEKVPVKWASARLMLEIPTIGTSERCGGS